MRGRIFVGRWVTIRACLTLNAPFGASCAVLMAWMLYPSVMASRGAVALGGFTAPPGEPGPGTVDEQGETAVGRSIRDPDLQGLRPAAVRAVVRHGPVQPRQPQQARLHASRPSWTKPDQFVAKKREAGDFEMRPA